VKGGWAGGNGKECFPKRYSAYTGGLFWGAGEGGMSCEKTRKVLACNQSHMEETELKGFDGQGKRDNTTKWGGEGSHYFLSRVRHKTRSLTQIKRKGMRRT